MKNIKIVIQTKKFEAELLELSKTRDVYISIQDFAELEGVTMPAIRHRVLSSSIAAQFDIIRMTKEAIYIKFNKKTPRGSIKSGPKT
ncbi:MAG: hypothetical protein JRJ49_03425 [Deltaproteobacteria bacterium]|nr:hypothetical protein [Deltaproteobacteria bacterium]